NEEARPERELPRTNSDRSVLENEMNPRGARYPDDYADLESTEKCIDPAKPIDRLQHPRRESVCASEDEQAGVEFAARQSRQRSRHGAAVN
ncbi:hypothetical protein, partial [Bradyrhizobium guangdongense]|uniref:hypothetical protein n=1 Tax=Bradyrhizobium guangdongense TaxID=1325090 RepID=UPI001AECBF19